MRYAPGQNVIGALRRSSAKRSNLHASALALLAITCTGCQQLVRDTDRQVAHLIEARQRAAVGQAVAVDPGTPDADLRAAPSARAHAPRPASPVLPASLEPAASQPATAPADATATQPARAPSREPGELFTLTKALAYAQQHRREYQQAQEELYRAALALTLERHLWTPIFASTLRTVYGNYGEARDFDQAMRFAGDLSVSQRLPYGGELTAAAVSTLIRDVKRTITAQEGSQVQVGLKVPLLRGAGHVSRETLIQLERELTYAVRIFERFRRQQLVSVAQAYFDLLRVKQQVLDSEDNYERVNRDYERAKALEQEEKRSGLDTRRALLSKLDAENGLALARESFRASADAFKLLIGMPVDEPLPLETLEDIESIETQIESGTYLLLQRPRLLDSEADAIELALQRRFDLLTAQDRIDDARRGVEINRNALLPNLDWSGSVSFDTDPEHYSLGWFHYDRANWRTELTLEVPLERTAERHAFRRALIGVRAAQRAAQELADRVRIDVRDAISGLALQANTLRIREQSVAVAEAQRDYTDMRYELFGDIDNRDKLEAEAAWLRARNQLNQAKTQQWTLLLRFRLATETLIIDEEGVQQPPPGP